VVKKTEEKKEDKKPGDKGDTLLKITVKKLENLPDWYQ